MHTTYVVLYKRYIKMIENPLLQKICKGRHTYIMMVLLYIMINEPIYITKNIWKKLKCFLALDVWITCWYILILQSKILF